MITREFNLYLHAGHSIPLVINVNQYDQGEQWLFTLFNADGTQYTPSSGAIVGIKSDNLGIINSGTVDSQGRVVINETQQMTASVGKAVFELVIDDGTHGTANFVVLVEEKPGNNADLSETDISMIEEAIEAASSIKPYGSPLVASTVAGMTDHEKVYVYVGSETGYTSGNWYYWDGTAWASGGVYNSVAVQTDTTLTLSGVAADAKKTGDEISDLKSQIAQSGGVSSTARNLFKTILENALYKTDQSANIDALIVALTPDTPVSIYTITYSLTNVTSSKNDPTIIGGESFTCTLTADEDYVLDSVTVMMGGTDITNTSYENGTVSIPLVTGNIVITATATALTVVKWDYSLGRLPSEDDGIGTTISSGSSVTTTFDAEKGIYVTGGTGDSVYVRYDPTNHQTMKKGYFEAVLTITASSENGQANSRLSNGTGGWNTSLAHQNALRKVGYKTSSNTIIKIDTVWELNTEYTFRSVYEQDGTNSIYLNGELVYSGTAVSTYYTTANRFYVQGAISAYIKSMKWVIEEA